MKKQKIAIYALLIALIFSVLAISFWRISGAKNDARQTAKISDEPGSWPRVE